LAGQVYFKDINKLLITSIIYGIICRTYQMGFRKSELLGSYHLHDYRKFIYPISIGSYSAAGCMETDDSMNIFLVVIFATIGADLGALINYYLARWLGRPIVYKFANSRFGHMCLIDEAKVRHAEEYFRKHGAASTFFGRLIPAVRQLISIPAGLAGMKLGSFLLYTTLGAGIWNTILALLGYFIYRFTDIKTTNDVYILATEYSHEIGYIILAVAVFVVGFLIYKGIKQKK
jgi:membrane protein DedA with SNARE-associated domain